MPGLNSGFKITAAEEGNPRGRVEVDFVPAEPQKMFRLQVFFNEIFFSFNYFNII